MYQQFEKYHFSARNSNDKLTAEQIQERSDSMTQDVDDSTIDSKTCSVTSEEVRHILKESKQSTGKKLKQIKQDIGQMREIAFDLHQRKQNFHQEFLDHMNDNIEDSNKAPQEPVVKFARKSSDKTSDLRSQNDQALRWQRAQNKFQKMHVEKERRENQKKDSIVAEDLKRSSELLQKELQKIEETEKGLMAQLYRANGGQIKARIISDLKKCLNDKQALIESYNQAVEVGNIFSRPRMMSLQQPSQSVSSLQDNYDTNRSKFHFADLIKKQSSIAILQSPSDIKEDKKEQELYDIDELRQCINMPIKSNNSQIQKQGQNNPEFVVNHSPSKQINVIENYQENLAKFDIHCFPIINSAHSISQKVQKSHDQENTASPVVPSGSIKFGFIIELFQCCQQLES